VRMVARVRPPCKNVFQAIERARARGCVGPPPEVHLRPSPGSKPCGCGGGGRGGGGAVFGGPLAEAKGEPLGIMGANGGFAGAPRSLRSGRAANWGAPFPKPPPPVPPPRPPPKPPPPAPPPKPPLKPPLPKRSAALAAAKSVRVAARGGTATLDAGEAGSASPVTIERGGRKPCLACAFLPGEDGGEVGSRGGPNGRVLGLEVWLGLMEAAAFTTPPAAAGAGDSEVRRWSGAKGLFVGGANGRLADADVEVGNVPELTFPSALAEPPAPADRLGVELRPRPVLKASASR
jgi:hypothetical protein